MFDFRNGKPLMDRLIPDGLSDAATSFVGISQNQFDYGKGATRSAGGGD